MRNLDQTRRRLKKHRITYVRIVEEVRRLYPDRTCSIWMVSHVLRGRARSRYVWAGIDAVLGRVAKLSNGAAA